VTGFVEDMAKRQNKSTEEIERDFFAHVRPSSLLKRFATVEEVAAMVAYVASELSSATNGAALRVDGGVVRLILNSRRGSAQLLSVTSAVGTSPAATAGSYGALLLRPEP